MKINLKKASHWLILLRIILGLSCGLLIRFFYSTNHIILFGHQLNGNLKPLATYLIKEKTPFFFFTLNNKQRLDLPKSNLLTAISIRHLIKITCAKIIVTDHGPQVLLPLLYLTNIHFIDVWHGLPFKGFDSQDFYWIQRYKQVWVSSALMKKIYHTKFTVDDDKIKITGYARTDTLLNTPLTSNQWHQQFNITNRTLLKHVLIAMTWHHHTTIQPVFDIHSEKMANALSAWGQQHQVQFIIRTHINQHPKTSPETSWLTFRSATDYPDTEALLIHTDLMVSDWSSIVFDFLALNKPIVYIDNLPPFQKGFTLDSSYRCGAIVNNPAHFFEKLEALLFKDQWKTYQTNYHTIMNKLYDDTLDGQVAKRYYQQLTGILA